MCDTAGMNEFMVCNIQNFAVSEAWKSTDAAVRMRRPSASAFCLPTIAESTPGLKLQDFDVSGWVAMYGPKGLPAPLVGRLQDAVARVLATPDIAQRFAGLGGEPRFMNAAELAGYEQSENRKWDEAVRYSGARLD